MLNRSSSDTDWEQDAARQEWGSPPEPGRGCDRSSSSILWPVHIYTEISASLWESHAPGRHRCTRRKKQQPSDTLILTQTSNKSRKQGSRGKACGVRVIWPAGDGRASVTRWGCWIPKSLPEILDVVEMEIHHHVQSGLGGREEKREYGEKRGGQNIQRWTMATRHTTKFLQAGERAARVLLGRQWASLNTPPCTLIIRVIRQDTSGLQTLFASFHF